MSKTKKPKFDWAQFASYHEACVTNNDDPVLHAAALLDLHERLDRQEHGSPTFAWVRELEERVKRLEPQAHWHTMPFQNDDLRARVAQFVEWLHCKGRESASQIGPQDVYDKLRELGLIEKEVPVPARKPTDLEQRMAQFVQWTQASWKSGMVESRPRAVLDAEEVYWKLRELGLREAREEEE